MSIDERIDTRADEEQDGFDYTLPPLENDETLDYEAAVKAAEYAAYWQGRITEVSDVYDAEHKKLIDKLEALTERREYEVGRLLRKKEYHETRIAWYHRQVLAADPKRKTLDLIHGSSRATVYAKPQVWADPKGAPDLLAWVKEQHPEILRGPNITDIRSVVDVDSEGRVVDKKTGEPVPGLVSQLRDTYVRFDADPWSPL
jgi:hypothetical protein